MRILLINAPLTDLYTAYPGVLYLSGYLKGRGYEVAVEDLSLAFGRRIFSKEGVSSLAGELKEKFLKKTETPPKVAHFLRYEDEYVHRVDAAIGHLQGREPGLSLRIHRGNFYPPSPNEEARWIYEKRVESRVRKPEAADPLSAVFGRLGLHDRARYVSSMFLRDIVSVINQGADPFLGVANYGVFTHEPAYWPGENPSHWRERIEIANTFCTRIMDDLAMEAVLKHQPDLIGISSPFNHTAFAALRMARQMKCHSRAPIVLGGHFATTSLRDMKTPWIFDYVDYAVLDNGERPMECIAEYTAGMRPKSKLLRTYYRDEGKIVFSSDPLEKDVSQTDPRVPDYTEVSPAEYVPVVYSLSSLKTMFYPVFTNKLKMSHGCYWGRCTFCDTKLEYIGNYDPYSIDEVFAQMKRIMKETGSSTFHFVDEAMPPKLVKKICERILNEKLSVSWWGYVRLDRGFTPDLARLMAQAGCIYVQAGVETPSDRLLKLIDKGTDLKQIAQISRNFARAGIFVETCLMYGFPTQTEQDTVDGLEFIRQLFAADCVHAAGWSRFYFSPHSRVADATAQLGIKVNWESADYENWDFEYIEENGLDHGRFERGLAVSTENFSMKAGFDKDVREWFVGQELPAPTLPKDFVESILRSDKPRSPSPSSSPFEGGLHENSL